MSFYFLWFFILWVSAYIGFVEKRNGGFKYLLVFSVILIALRYETGNDWLSYKNLFEITPSLVQATFGQIKAISFESGKSYLFILYLSTLKGITDEFQIVVFTSSIIYFYSLQKLIRYKTNEHEISFALIYSWLLFNLFISTINQSLSIALFILAWLSYDKERYGKAITLASLSILFHVSSIMYLLLFVASFIPIRKIYLVVSWVLVMLLMITNYDGLKMLMESMSVIIPDFLNSKISYYFYERNLPTNKYDIVFVYAFTVFVGAWMLLRYKKKSPKEINQAYLISFYFVIFQAISIHHTVFRYRVLYFALPIIFILISNYYSDKNKIRRLQYYLLFFALSFSYHYLYLTKEDSKTFVPYQNYIYINYQNIEGSGEERLMDVIKSRK